jgi:TonB family protein
MVGFLSNRIDQAIGPDDPSVGIDEDLVFFDVAPAPAGSPAAAAAEPPPPPIVTPEIPPLVVPALEIDITPDIAPPLPPINVPDRIQGFGRGGVGQAAGGAGTGSGGAGAGGPGTGGGGAGGAAATAIPLMVLVPPAPPSSVQGERATLLLHIDETGRVVEVEITESSGDADYDDQLRSTALDWQFRPATHPTLGPVPSVFEISFQF